MRKKFTSFKSKRYKKEQEAMEAIISGSANIDKLFYPNTIYIPPFVREAIIYEIVEDKYKFKITYLKSTFDDVPFWYFLTNRPSHVIKILEQTGE